MDILGIFKNSLVFPIKNWKIFIIVGFVVLISNLFSQFDSSLFSSGNLTIGGFLFGVVSIIATLLLAGYYLSIMRDTINHSDELPFFNLGKNLVDSIKLIILNFIYLLIPLAILFISSILLGIFTLYEKLAPYITNYGSNYINYVPENLLFNFAIVIMILLLVGIIALIVTFLFLYIAQARLAKYDSLVCALQFRDVLKDISKINWGDYILFIILFVIILVILAVIDFLIGLFGIVGFLISSIFIYNFTQIFTARTIGLIYRNTENNEKENILN